MTNIVPCFKYTWLTLKHKFFVFFAGIKIGVPIWRLIKHDWTKFLPSELPHYGRQFFGDKSQPDKFAIAWLRHQNRHEHHWEYWIPRTKHFQNDNKLDFLEMPDNAINEMVADWMGASKAYTGKWPVSGDWPWLDENLLEIKSKMIGTYAWLKLLNALIDNGLYQMRRQT